MSNKTPPTEVGSNAGFGHLLPCPMCGAEKGYQLLGGSTYRWLLVSCAGCGSDVGECRADPSLPYTSPIPEISEWADDVWNESAAHAQALREDNERLRRFLAAARDEFLRLGHEGSAAACSTGLGPNV